MRKVLISESFRCRLESRGLSNGFLHSARQMGRIWLRRGCGGSDSSSGDHHAGIKDAPLRTPTTGTFWIIKIGFPSAARASLLGQRIFAATLTKVP